MLFFIEGSRFGDACMRTDHVRKGDKKWQRNMTNMTKLYPTGVTVEAVGIESNLQGRSCEQHETCGSLVKGNVVLRLRKVQVDTVCRKFSSLNSSTCLTLEHYQRFEDFSGSSYGYLKRGALCIIRGLCYINCF